MMWVLLTKSMQKSVITVCLHCSFAGLKNKHMGVLGTNVATMSWLHWSPVLGIKLCKLYRSHFGVEVTLTAHHQSCKASRLPLFTSVTNQNYTQ